MTNNNITSPVEDGTLDQDGRAIDNSLDPPTPARRLRRQVQETNSVSGLPMWRHQSNGDLWAAEDDGWMDVNGWEPVMRPCVIGDLPHQHESDLERLRGELAEAASILHREPHQVIDVLRAANWNAIVVLRAELAEAKESLAWIRKKIGVPEDAQMFTGKDTIAGQLHVIRSHSDGYMKYITAYKCNDKQGEIARQSVRITELESELAEAKQQIDAEMELLKAREHIAEGDEGWEKLAGLCPSTSAVAAIRSQLAEARRELGRYEPSHSFFITDAEYRSLVAAIGMDVKNDPPSVVFERAPRTRATRLAPLPNDGKRRVDSSRGVDRTPNSRGFPMPPQEQSGYERECDPEDYEHTPQSVCNDCGRTFDSNSIRPAAR
ncbi:MAG: hypothetical protein ACREA9_17555 [Pyrinomonadaceae bacterium]